MATGATSPAERSSALPYASLAQASSAPGITPCGVCGNVWHGSTECSVAAVCCCGFWAKQIWDAGAEAQLFFEKARRERHALSA